MPYEGSFRNRVPNSPSAAECRHLAPFAIGAKISQLGRPERRSEKSLDDENRSQAQARAGELKYQPGHSDEADEEAKDRWVDASQSLTKDGDARLIMAVAVAARPQGRSFLGASASERLSLGDRLQESLQLRY